MGHEKRITQFNFWQKWLFYSSIAFAIFGIAFAVYGENPLFQPYNRSVAHIIWKISDTPEQVASYKKFIFGSLGGTIACCYILLAFIAKYPFKRKEVWARNAIILAFGIWIILDSVICVYYEVYFQIYVINAFSFLQKALPIIFTWKDFRTAK